MAVFGRFQLETTKVEHQDVQVEAPNTIPRFLSGPLETLLLAAVLGVVLVGGWWRETRRRKPNIERI